MVRDLGARIKSGQDCVQIVAGEETRGDKNAPSKGAVEIKAKDGGLASEVLPTLLAASPSNNGPNLFIEIL